MYKKESSPGRRLCAFLLVPAIAAGCALTSVPAVANVLSSLSATEVVAQSDNKVSEKIPETEALAVDKSEITDSPDKIAEPQGGFEGMMKYLMYNVQYPEAAEKAGEEGKVVVRFVVGADGVICDPEIQTSISPSLDAEALRVVKSMPAWTPAIKDGQPVATYFVLPISFKMPKAAEEKK